ncbi:MAG: 4a-hydroxytetrahydrobiopterin dehydratase [Nakamurella sp.]
MTDAVISATEFSTVDLPHWRFILRRLHTRFKTPDYETGLALVARIGAAAQAADHHPEIDLHYGSVGVITSSHDVGGVTQRDIDLAAAISAIADELGATADPTSVQVLDLGLNTSDPSRIQPFWQALLGAKVDDDELLDPVSGTNLMWFQESAETATGPDSAEMRFHADVVVANDVAQERIDAVLTAGGRLVTDKYAPSFWVLADADGNQACICTELGRD